MMMIGIRSKVLKMFGSVAMFSTSTESAVSVENLVFRIVDPLTPMAPILNQWIEEGNDVTQPELNSIITRLSRFRRFTHALQVSEWMSNERNYDLTPGDIAKRINLLSKVRGLEQAESFFKGVPDAKIGVKVYTALLKCYVDHKSLEEAEAVMKKVELRPMNLTVCYNLMLKLYAQMGKYDKLDRLMQEMKAKDICNAATFTIRLNAYVAAADIEEMEKFLMQMEADPVATVDWCTYTTAANGYLKIHNFEKVTTMLRKSEHIARGKKTMTMRLAFESLQSMYAAIGNKDEVYRLWNRMKSFKYSHNSSYISVLSSLVKLDDIDGAEKILEEWESKYTHYDARIPNLMIGGYCKCGRLDKAEAYIRRLLDSGKKVNGRTWDRLAGGYRMDNDMEKAVQTMKKAVSSNRLGWRPNPFTLVDCIKYQKEKGDLELALEILELCKENNHLSVTSYDRLLSYVHSEMPDTEPLDLIKEDYQMDGNAQLLDREQWFNVKHE